MTAIAISDNIIFIILVCKKMVFYEGVEPYSINILTY